MEDRVFFCFSGKDRLVYAQSLNFHLKNLGIEVWYDYEKLYLGDDGDYVNIEEGVEQSKIFLLFISTQLFQSTGAMLELDAIKTKIDKYQEIVIIPILCEITSSQIPKKYNWISKYIYGEMKLDISSGTYDLSIDILKRLLYEQLKSVEIKNLLTLENITTDKFINAIIDKYNYIDKNCFSTRITMLYTLVLYCLEKYNINDNISYYSSSFIFNKVKFNIQPTLKEIACMESIILVLINKIEGYFFNNM